MTRPNLKQDILRAASRVLAREGLGRTTVEAVAKEAGVSKGGLFYYFLNKKEMLTGMLELYEEEFLRDRDSIAASLPPSPRRLLLAAAMLMIKRIREASKDISNLATLLDDPDLCRWIGAFKQRVLDEAGRELENKAGVAMVGYIIDGLWMDARFEAGPSETKYQDEAVEKLMEYIGTLR